MTYRANEAKPVPIITQSFHNGIRYRFLALSALRAIAIGMAAHTPCIPILLNKWCCAIKWIATLSAEEVPSMPFGTACHNDFAFNRSLAALASWTKQLVEVKVAVEPKAGVTICHFKVECFFGRSTNWYGHCHSCLSSLDSLESFRTPGLWFRVECNKLQVGVTLVADEALGMEALTCCTEYAAGNW
jgi:hypothetical protein